MAENSFLQELTRLLPFFILHLSSGMAASFTTVLIEHYEKHFSSSKDEFASNKDLVEAMIGTFQDIPPIIVALIGGYLQQVFGPRKVLIASGFPSILSWILVAAGPSSISCLLMSRICAGLAFGLLSGNVYMVHVASDANIGSMKMVELASKNLGCIFMFIGMIAFEGLGIDKVSCISGVFPVIGLIGLCCIKEDPIFSARQQIYKSEKKSDEKSSTTQWIRSNMENLKVPIFSPTIFKPLVLISALVCLQQCSGSLYIRKFIIQILESESKDNDGTVSVSIKSYNNHSLSEEIDLFDKTESDKDESVNLNYFLPLIIFTVRLMVLFLMAFMIKRIRMRFLYFLSLFLTVTILCILGLVSDRSVVSGVDGTSIKFIKTMLLCLHVFFIQLGVQTLPGLLTDILFPTSCAAIMKGATRAISSVILIFFVFIFKNLEYSHAFYLMSTILVVSIPFLYLFVPEIRNVGTEMSAEFFLPSQTVFYFVLPENLKRCPDKRKNALRHWKSAYRKITVHNAFFGDKIKYEMDVDMSARTYSTVKFDKAMRSVEEVFDNERNAKLNNDRLNFVSNILGQGNFLVNNRFDKRILIGRGPVTITNNVMKKGSIFLFNDVMIVAKCVVSNRRYVGEECFKLDDVKLEKTANFIRLTDMSEKTLEIELDDISIANIWEKYIIYWSQRRREDTDQDHVDTDDQAQESPGSSIKTRLLVKTRTISYTLPPEEDVPDNFV